jgi:molecular chaperone IbpA
VRGKKADETEEKSFLYRGIANRSFERKFNLADHIEVQGADLKNGLLTISLVKEVPEAMKPRNIAINPASATIEHKEDARKVA